MKSIIQENKGVLRFIAIFLISYIILSFGYSLYLKSQVGLDGYSKIISNQTIQVLNGLGYETYGDEVIAERHVKLIVRNKFVAFVTEGCNAISIMILFLAFVLSFAKKIKPTIVFSLFGLGLIYVVNLFRIVLLTVILYYYPSYTKMLHGVLFPGLIYGAVFLLWMVWVRFIQKQKS